MTRWIKKRQRVAHVCSNKGCEILKGETYFRMDNKMGERWGNLYKVCYGCVAEIVHDHMAELIRTGEDHYDGKE